MTRTKADGTEITYTYDENNRLTKVGYPDASEVTYTYDALGARIKMQDKNGETTYTYTDLNQLKTVVRSGSAITYDYDTAGNLTTIKYPDGKQLKYTYNPVNLPIFVLDGTNTLEITYDETNKRLIENLPNGIKVQYDYDESGRLKKLQHEAEGNIIAKTEYTLDKIGNRINIVDKENQSNTYTYDELSQLIQVDEANGNTVQYTYDPVGNRQKMNGEIKEDNLLLKENVTYEYDYEDRLIGYEDGTNTITYTYDGDGNLIGKTITGEINESKAYYYDHSKRLPRLLVEKNSNGDTNKYLYAGRLYSRTGPEGQVYYHQDGLGSTIAITDDTAQIQNEYQYDEFGNHTVLQENIENNMLYTGELLDESGLYYLRARYYDPKVGRFITEDTLFGEIHNPITQNLYIYVGNNPMLYIDPSGHIPTPMEAAKMADHIYDTSDKKKRLSGKWVHQRTITGGENMKMGVYYRVKEDGTTEYALVNKGTTPSKLGDWVNNVQQPFGYSDDMKASITKSTEFVNNHLHNEITMIGHSKGGAEAAANAVANDKNSIIFNPATVSLSEYGLSSDGYTASMTAYIVKGEALNKLFNVISKPIDQKVSLKKQYKTPWWHFINPMRRDVENVKNAIKNHSMEAVIKALKEQRKDRRRCR